MKSFTCYQPIFGRRQAFPSNWQLPSPVKQKKFPPINAEKTTLITAWPMHMRAQVVNPVHCQEHKHRLAGVQSPEELPCSARATQGCSALPTPHPPGTHAAGLLQRGWSGAVCSGLHLSTLVSIVLDNIRKGSHHYLQTFFFFSLLVS